MVEYLIRELKDHYNIVTLSRGYGRKTKGFLWVETQLAADQTGDEPLQIKTKFNTISVAVCEDRVAGVRRILADKPDTNLILLDDAFQHRAIKPSVHILLSEYTKPFYTDWLLPGGRLRESRQGANRADAIIFTKCPSHFVPLKWRNTPVFHSQITYQKREINGPVLGFSALADNSIFKNHLAETFDLVGFKEYRDHHQFTNKDVSDLLKNAPNATLVCTEKDWVKIQALGHSTQIKHIPIATEVLENDKFLIWLKKQLS
jgi:tetraacyldisaccharide 4'-kinase